MVFELEETVAQNARMKVVGVGGGGGNAVNRMVDEHLTGGGAHLAGVVELAREVFAMPARAGEPNRGISGLVDSVQAPRYAVPVGLALYSARQKMPAGAPGDSVDRIFAPVKRWLQDFF